MNQDEFLTEIIGKPVYNILAPCEEYKSDSIFCCRTDFPDFVDILIKQGFNLITVEIQLSRQVPPSHERYERYRGVALEIFEREEILRIAETCFFYDRFHKDNKIGEIIANKIKRQWALNCLMHKRGNLVLAEQGGFLFVIKRFNDEGGIDYIVDLIGVDKSARGKGIGRRLIEQLFTYAQNQFNIENSRIITGTQMPNISSLKLYRTTGFDRIDGFNYVFHLHT